MRIAINAQLLNYPDFGVKIYLQNLIEQLQQNDKANQYSFLSDNKQNKLWEHLILPGIINRGKYGLFHSPDHILPLLPIKCKKMITVHDLAFIRLPKAFSLKKRAYKNLMAKYSIIRSDMIIADSNNTKNDIMDIFKIKENKVRVVYLAAGAKYVPVNDKNKILEIKQKYKIDRPYILFVGTLEPRKNILNVINSFSLAADKYKIEHDLILAGKRGWLYEPIYGLIKDSKYKERIRILDNISADELPAIYSEADLFVYPSLYEGFGLPPLEAMACGVPVITSNNSSLPEVVGDAAIKIDPKDIEQIAYETARVLNSNEIRDSLSKKGLERAKLFSWEKCAKDTIKIYEEIGQ